MRYAASSYKRKARAKRQAKRTDMGRGDTKSARGKIFKGSWGKWRPRTKKKNVPKKAIAGMSKPVVQSEP